MPFKKVYTNYIAIGDALLTLRSASLRRVGGLCWRFVGARTDRALQAVQRTSSIPNPPSKHSSNTVALEVVITL